MVTTTITDVADFAGVSKKTVSRVLNNEPNVSLKTREKVQEAIKALNFKRNPLGLALARKRSFLVALLYDNPSPGYLSHLQNGIIETCKTEGLGLFLHKCDYQSPTLADEVEDLINKTMVAGLVLTPPVCDQQVLLKRLREHQVEYVSITPAEISNSPCVSTNNLQATCDMITYLIELGHRRIGLVLGNRDQNASAIRESGFRQAFEAKGLTVDETLVVPGAFTFESGQVAAQQLLDMPYPPTAIFASNDEMAAGVLYTAHSRGIKVPEQLTITGFDDTPFAHQVWPRLTTVRQPLLEMGRSAAALLIERINTKQPSEKFRHIALSCELILRESSATPANHV